MYFLFLSSFILFHWSISVHPEKKIVFGTCIALSAVFDGKRGSDITCLNLRAVYEAVSATMASTLLAMASNLEEPTPFAFGSRI